MQTNEIQPELPTEIQDWEPILSSAIYDIIDLMSRHPEQTAALGPIVKKLHQAHTLVERDILLRNQNLTWLPVSQSPTPTNSGVIPEGQSPQSGENNLADEWRHSATSLGVQNLLEKTHTSPTKADDEHAMRVTNPGEGKFYTADSRMLREFIAGEKKPVLQVSRTNYHRVASSIARNFSLNEAPEGLSAVQIREGTNAETETKNSKNTTGPVAQTQVYLCLRFWQAIEMIDRYRGGTFRPRDSMRNFLEWAEEAWESARASQSTQS